MFSTYILLVCLFAMIPIHQSVDPAVEEEMVEAINFLLYINLRYLERTRTTAEASWSYMTNITDETEKAKITICQKAAIEAKDDWEKLQKFHWHSYKDPNIHRLFKQHSILGIEALPQKKHKKLIQLINNMQRIYSTAKVCEYQNSTNCNLNLDPEITEVFRSSRDPLELKYYWIEWRKAVGPKVKLLYDEYIKLSNEAARLNNFPDNTEFWLSDFEADDIRDQIEGLWQQVKPLYLQMHAYVRFKLKEKYGDIVDENGLIPVHLLGNMWAQGWGSIAKEMLPYPNAQNIDLTKQLLKQNYTTRKMFQVANEFFVSINLTDLPETFWKKSILEKPTDGRAMVCHASAWDFYRDDDVRIKMCTTVNLKNFYTIHHELGHIQYYLQYAHQPGIFRTGANSGFHEAVGDVITLSVKSPKHLKRIGLINVDTFDDELDLNILFTNGMDKMAFLPFGYIIDLWRWDSFSRKTPKENWNCKWWDLRADYQGVEPPVERSEDDFDPAAKFHVPADVPYIRYFVSHILQFQFHRTLCLRAGEYIPGDPNKPLHQCDIYQNKEAGNLLAKMLQMGSSKPWPDAMEVLTGQRQMDATGLLEYFKPLHSWLEQENEKNNVTIGWDVTKKHCSSSPELH